MAIALEDRAVADNRQRWQPTTQPLRQRAAGGPCAAFQYARQRHLLASAPSSARTSGASSSSSATVNARHSTIDSSPIIQDGRVQAGSCRCSTPVSSSRPPLRYSGRPVSASRPSTRTPAHPKGSSSEYVSHCDSLWNGTQPCGQAGAAHRLVVPAVAEPLSTDHVVRQPDARQRSEEQRQDVVRSHRAVAVSTSTSNRPPGRPTGPNTSGCAASASPSRRSRSTRPSRPTNGLDGPAWKASASGRGSSAPQAGRIHLARVRRIAGEQPAHEGAQARYGKPFGARESLSAGTFQVMPVRACACVE